MSFFPKNLDITFKGVYIEVSLYLGAKRLSNMGKLAAFLAGVTVLDFNAIAASECGRKGRICKKREFDRSFGYAYRRPRQK
jgi:hypothetical protein